MRNLINKMIKLKCLLPVLMIALAVSNPIFAAEKLLEFTPENGFSGQSQGIGTLKLLLRKPRPFHVTSHGKKLNDGSFRLEQTITFQGKPPKDRFWILTKTSNNKYSATLSDAAGQVKGETSGSHLSLKYRIKGPLMMHQDLELLADGITIKNVGVIKLFGITVGRLKETITREKPSLKSE